MIKKGVNCWGSPGTGKSVVAFNLLVDIIQDDMDFCYVTKNTALREVFYKKLKCSS